MAELTRGQVTDTITFSSVDGPGNRFVVFLQGCTFNCAACHNPHTINPCIDCGLCLPVCPSGALSLDVAGHVRWDEARCGGEDACLSACPHDSTPKVRDVDVAAVLDRIRVAAPFLSGVTVSGGEATMKAGFVAALFRAARADAATAHLTLFIDSNGDAPTSTWRGLAPFFDGAMIDLKCLDPQIHRRITGSPNDATLAAISLLADLGKLHEVRLLLIPGINDSDELLAETGAWLAQVDPRMRIVVLGFRPHGVRPTHLALVEPTVAQREHYRQVLAAQGAFTIEVR